MSFDALMSVRYAGDLKDAAEIGADEHYQGIFKDYRDDYALGSVRKNFLADAVRIDRHVLPDLDEAIDALTERLGMSGRVECYVHSCPTIQAGVARSADGFIIVLGSAAIEKLNPKELEFVIGHELGHVIYGHLDVPMTAALQGDKRLLAKHAMRLLSWSRKKEISADRAGLISCGSLEAAASALFKTASGLSIPGLKVNPLEIGSQFDALQREIFRQGAEEMGMWTLSHPLVPLRMKSLSLFWNTRPANDMIPEATGAISQERCDREISQMLAHMDPLAQRGDGGADPQLRPLIAWSGLYVAVCNGSFAEGEHRSLVGFVGEAYLQEALDGLSDPQRFRERLTQALQDRRQPLCALDIHRIFTSLITIARADGSIEEREAEALHELAILYGVAPAYVDSLMEAVE
jgi:hypothetical protein